VQGGTVGTTAGTWIHGLTLVLFGLHGCPYRVVRRLGILDAAVWSLSPDRRLSLWLDIPGKYKDQM
jgi:hypothetical protein